MSKQKKRSVSSNLSKTLYQYVRGKSYKAMTADELIRALSISEIHHDLFHQILNESVKSGEMIKQDGKYKVPSKKQTIIGVISVHAKGFGFVRVEEGDDVFIPKPVIHGAVDGDTVEAEVNPVVSAKGPEGVVVSIVKRSKTHIGGIIVSKTGRHYVAFSPMLGQDKPLIVKSKTVLHPGDRIICLVTTWENDAGAVEGNMSKKIGHISDPSIDIEAAVAEFAIPNTFSAEAVEEAKSFGTKASAKGRKDITAWEIVTIDPDTARDFDDAISLTKDENGHYRLGVHIADVAHYVKPGSNLDREALLRCNSTYFPGKCVPMLPEELSNELCSLNPKVIRLTQSVFAEFTPTGELVTYSVARTAIKSKKRFTYKEALEVIEGKKKSPHKQLLDLMVELCHVLKKKRYERGSIDFSMPEDVIMVDAKGVPTKIERVEYDITHQMIEEFMLKANELVATHLASLGKEVIYRVHEEPAPESFQEFFSFARSLGFQLPGQPEHKDIQKLFQEAHNSPLLPQLSVAFIRSMRLAVYSSKNGGHYGLALTHYCHFTSPIRRYTDLITQRQLFDELPKDTKVEEIANACSEKERVSFRAESSVVLLKKLRLADTYYQDNPQRHYDAIITKLKPFYLSFEIPIFDLEGSLHVSKIGEDYYEFNQTSRVFKGRNSGKTFASGAPILVKLEKIDFLLMQTEWSVVHQRTTPAKRKKKR